MSDPIKIWSRFEAKQKDGNVLKLRIETLPVNRQREAVDYYMKYYIQEEACHKAAGIARSADAMEEYEGIVTAFFQTISPHLTICCIDDETGGDGEFLGMSIVQLTSDKVKLSDLLQNFDVKTKEVQQLFSTAKVLDEFAKDKKYDTFYEGRGLIVHPDYRKMGIAYELVKTRELICQDDDIPVTFAWMTAIGSQVSATKNNWKTFADVTLDEMAKRTGLTFDKNLDTFKYMYKIAK